MSPDRFGVDPDELRTGGHLPVQCEAGQGVEIPYVTPIKRAPSSFPMMPTRSPIVASVAVGRGVEGETRGYRMITRDIAKGIRTQRPDR